MERWHRRFRFSSAGPSATPDRRESAGAVFQKSASAPHIENGAGQNLRQRLDRDERRDFEGRHNRREFCHRGGISGYEVSGTKRGSSGQSSDSRQKI